VAKVVIRYLYKFCKTKLVAQNLMQILVGVLKRESALLIFFPLDERYIKLIKTDTDLLLL